VCCVEPSINDEDKIFGHMRLQPSVSSVKLYLAKIAERISDPSQAVQFICGYEVGFVGYSLYHKMSATGFDVRDFSPVYHATASRSSDKNG
jgi:hypothetical protein